MEAEILQDGWRNQDARRVGILRIGAIYSEPEVDRQEAKRIGVAVELMHRSWIYFDNGPRSGAFLVKAINSLQEAGFNLKKIKSIGYYGDSIELEDRGGWFEVLNHEDGIKWFNRPKKKFRTGQTVEEVEAYRTEI